MMAVEERTVRKGYKMTELGEIPVEWEVLNLKNVFKLTSGNYLPSKSIIEGPYAVYGGNGITAYHHEYMFENSMLVIGRVGALCGNVTLSKEKIWITDNALYVDKKLTPFDDNFMCYLLEQLNLNSYANKNAQPVISGQIIYSIVIGLPNLKEQQKIAEVLSTVDEQIENTKKLIGKTKELKKGLMQRLLTRGIGHTEFKMTELGEIPVGWEVVQLQDLFDLVSRPIKMNDKQEYRLVTVKRRHGGIVERGRLLGKLIKVKSQYLIKEGDFLISKRQIVHGACEVVRKDLEDSIVSNEYHTLLATEKLDIEYFRWLSQTQLVMGYFLRASIGVHIEKMLFKLSDWYKYKIAVPPIKEQQKIAEILSSVDEQISSYQEEKEKYTELKKGLMQQLLTGKIRVNV